MADRCRCTSALPGWTGYIGDTQATTALHNNNTLGTASIDILGPVARNYNDFGPSSIEGRYAVMLQPGGAITNSAVLVETTIAQTGVVPETARFLMFKGYAWNFASEPFSVSLGGQPLSLINLGPAINSTTLYGASISSFAGKQEELKFTVYADSRGPDFLTLDSIQFTSVPEPSVLSLACLGGLLFGFSLWKKRWRA